MDWLLRRRRDSVAAASRGTSDPWGASEVREFVPSSSGGRDYIFGQSEAEISRLDMQHFLFRWELRGDFGAPVMRPEAMLDVACGTGRWAREQAVMFPGARVLGFDINQQQLQQSLEEDRRRGVPLPANCSFGVADALQPFPFAAATFDLVMARATSSFIPAARWPLVVAEMARVCKPGGWVELRDFGLVQSKHEALNELTVRFARLASQRGIYPGSGPYLGDFLHAAGLEQVRVQTVTVRSGGQAPTRGGRLMLVDYLALLERVGPGIAQAGLDPRGDWTRLLSVARHEMAMDPERHFAEVELTAAWGMKRV
jgi:ubiquinone/menaquinone biosynthesis C-methylase UbiE